MSERTTGSEDWSAYRSVGAQIHRGLRTWLAAVSFWGAILLPFIYVPGLFHSPDTSEAVLGFLGLIGLHLVALVGGRNHDPERAERGVGPQRSASD